LSYALPLASIGVIAGFIGGSIIGTTVPFVGGTFRTPILTGAGMAVLALLFMLIGVFILSLVINALATSFGGEKNSAQALKVAVYSYTPAWIAGAFQILPWVGWVLALVISLYGIYLLYTGLPVLMKSPEDKSIGYTIVVIICAIVLSIIITTTSAFIFGAGALATGAFNTNTRSSAGNVSIDPASPLGKLEQFGKQMEDSSNAMEAAQKSGDKNAEAAAATAAMGALFGGGKKVDPLSLEQLKAFIPDMLAGMPKKSSSAETTGIAGLMVARAEAGYADDSGNKTISLEISDAGSAAGLMGLTTWANVQSEKEDQYMSEKTMKVGNRMINQVVSKQAGGSNEYTVMLGDRFIVAAQSSGIEFAQLKAAVNALDLSKLEAMKDLNKK
jgi:hypothetical protein